MNILVTGANGQLGNEMRLKAIGSRDKFFFTDICEVSEDSSQMLDRLSGGRASKETVMLDITDLDSVRDYVSNNDIHIIVNCAAYTNVDAAEKDYDAAELLNAKAPENLAVAMKEVGGCLVHVSTDYVFGGEPYNTPCKEDRKGTPTGVYGVTKLHGEQNIQRVGDNYMILRTAWLYSEFGKNFVKTMLNLTRIKSKLKVVFDQVGTPTYAGDLADIIMKIVTNRWYEGHSGIYHYSNEGVCSWFDFTKIIALLAGNDSCKISPCYSADFPSPVERPSYSVLDKAKIKETFEIEIPYWTEPLRTCISHLLTK